LLFFTKPLIVERNNYDNSRKVSKLINSNNAAPITFGSKN